MDDVLAMLDGARIPSPQTARESLPPTPGEPVAADRRRRGQMVLIVASLVVAAARARAAFGYSYLAATIRTCSGGPDSETNVVSADVMPDHRRSGRAGAERDQFGAAVGQLHLARHRRHRGRRDRHDGRDARRRRRSRRRRATRSRSALAQAGLREPECQLRRRRADHPGGLRRARRLPPDPGARAAAISTTAQPRFEMTLQSSGAYAGREAATARLDLDVSDAARTSPWSASSLRATSPCCSQSRAMFEQALAASRGGRPISAPATAATRVHIDADHTGWSGILLISGRGPFDRGLIQPAVGAARAGLAATASCQAAAAARLADRDGLVRIGQPPGRSAARAPKSRRPSRCPTTRSRSNEPAYLRPSRSCRS